MNSTVGFIFNESFLLKKKFVSPVNSAWDPHKTPNASENAASGVFKHNLNKRTTNELMTPVEMG